MRMYEVNMLPTMLEVADYNVTTFAASILRTSYKDEQSGTHAPK